MQNMCQHGRQSSVFPFNVAGFIFFVGGATSTLSSLSSLSSPTSSLGVLGITSGSSSACGAVGLFGGEQSRSGSTFRARSSATG